MNDYTLEELLRLLFIILAVLIGGPLIDWLAGN